MTDRTRTITWDDPLATAGAAKGRKGIDLLREILRGAVPPAPIQRTLGFDFVSAEEGVVRFRLVPNESHYNPMNAVHGGVACVLLDSAMGCATMSVLDEKTGYATTHIGVHLTRPITKDTGPIAAEGRVVHRGGRVVTSEGRLTDEQGRLLAHATCSCLLLER